MIQLTILKSNETARIDLAGRFDFNGRKVMREAYDPILADSKIKSIEIGLEKVDYIDSSALGILLLLRERAEESQKKVVLCRAQGTVGKVLAVANFNRLFEIRE